MIHEKRIIVVEDDKDINELLAYNLRKEGFSVEQAFDGREASRKLRNENFTIAIIDIMLPGVDGLELCREIKGSGNPGRTFVIMVTAKSSPQDKLYAHILGADCYFTKPFNVRELMSMVHEISDLQHKEFVVTSK